MLAYAIDWRYSGEAVLGCSLPVVFGEGVNGEVDATRLQEVIHFNATDPRKNWKSPKKKSATKHVDSDD